MLTNNIYLLICFIIFFLFDYVLRNLFIEHGIMELYDNFTLGLVLLWCFILTFIAGVLTYKIKKFFLILMGIISLIILYGQTIYFNLFYKFFSFADMSLMEEGAKYVDFSYFTINQETILYGVLLFLGLILTCFIIPKKQSKQNKLLICLLLGGGILFSSIHANNHKPSSVDPAIWNASSSPSYIYETYNDTTKALLMSGTYQYTFKNFAMTFLPVNEIKNLDMVNQINQYKNNTEPKYSNNDMTGLFKGKNLILIQLENIDQWMLTEKNMPTLYKLQNEGINFINHYSASFSTGRTFNTEYIANTGFVPPLNGTAPSYIFSKNTYPLSLANRFKQAGYTVNSYHSNGGHIYNRRTIHETFGYEKYHDANDMLMDDYTRDSQLINGYETMIHDKAFMDFIITYSAHGPFDISLDTCSANIDRVKPYENIQDETYLCGMAQAKETESFIASLIERMEEDGQINNTVLIFYTDHYAYSTINSDLELQLKGTNDPNLLFNTPFFIWAQDIQPQTITKYTSTVDILPTIINLFGIKTDNRYYVGKDIFEDNDNGYVCFADGSYYDGDTYYIGGSEDFISENVQNNIKDFWQKLDLSWSILRTDYFKQHKIE